MRERVRVRQRLGAHAAPVLAGALMTLSMLPGACLALEVSWSGIPLAERPTTFAPAHGAPETVFRKAGVASELRAGGPASSFAGASQPATVFRAAEVAPARVEITRELLGSLQARRTETQAIAIDLPADVLFDFDRSELRADAQEPLAKAGELLASYPQAQVAVHGHTDGKGTEAYNDALSLRRAQAVAQRLGSQAARQIDVKGWGSRKPVASERDTAGNDDPAGRQRNRRVEILIQPVRPVS